MKSLRKPATKIGNAARRAVQREIRVMSSSNPLTKAGYDLVETLIKTAKSKRKRTKKGTGNVSKQVTAPAVIGSVQQSGQFKSNGFENRSVSGTETFISIYRPTDSNFDVGGVFDLSANSPGLINLAREAQNYQTYRFTKLELTYEPVSATQQPGQILFGSLTDPTDQPPESFEACRAIRDSVSTPVWQKVCLKIPCDKTDRYVDGDQSSSSDVRFQVMRRIFIASIAVTTGQSTGCWTMNYTCILNKRKPSSNSVGVLELNAQTQPFSSILSQFKSTPYYSVAPSGLVTFNMSGRFRAQLSVASDVDQPIPNITITNGGSVVPASTQFLAAGFKNITDTNNTLLVVSVSFTLKTRGAVIDLSNLLSLSGTGSLMLSIEPDSSRLSI